METKLNLYQSDNLVPHKYTNIEKQIEKTIDLYKGNKAAISKLTLDSVTVLVASESRAKEIEKQGVFRRFWNTITGKNKKIRAQINNDMVSVQHASQHTLNKLSEQNLLTFDLITTVNNKLNTLAVETDLLVNDLFLYFKQTRSDVLKLENRVANLERNVDLLHWTRIIEYQLENGVEYSELPLFEKIICVTNDFFHHSKGEWNTKDLMLLKATLADLGIDVKSDIRSSEFFLYLIEKMELIHRLFKGVSLEGLNNFESFELPVLKGIEKMEKISNEEQYLYETIATHLTSSNVSFEKIDVQISLIRNYLIQTAFMDIDLKVNIFDFVCELLLSVQMINSSIVLENNQTYIEENSSRSKVEENNKDEHRYNVKLVRFGGEPSISQKDFMPPKFLKRVNELTGKTYTRSKDVLEDILFDRVPLLASDVSLEAAKEIEGKFIHPNIKIVYYRLNERIEIFRNILEGDTPSSVLTRQLWFNHLPTIPFIEKGSEINIGDEFLMYTSVLPGFKMSYMSSGKVLPSSVNGRVETVLISNGQLVRYGEPILVVRVND